LKSPWISANVQGFVISALVRAWRITQRPKLLDLAKGAARVFELTWDRGGVRVEAEGHVVFTEAPGLPAPGIMDGFMRSLLGLYDLCAETDDPQIMKLYKRGVDGLRYFLPRWDYMNKWSMYANREYLCSPEYHCLNRLLLAVLARLTNDERLVSYARAWDPDNLSTLGRAEIYLAHIVTKNACRVRYRTWRHKTSKDLFKEIPSFETTADAATLGPTNTTRPAA
jgi:hypothetical protein